MLTQAEADALFAMPKKPKSTDPLTCVKVVQNTG